ncbi:hypothetical protein SLE2022_383840 [Rubroshorea leprosula]
MGLFLWFPSHEIIKNYSFPFHIFTCRPLLASLPLLHLFLCFFIISSTHHILSFILPTPNTRLNSGRKMYPKVKVRLEQDKDDSGSILSFALVESFSSQEKENQWDSDSPPIVARVTKANSISASKVVNNQKNNGEERKLSERAASVPRPRAVLSSPDNDGMIGNRNRLNDGGSVLAPKRLQFHDVQKMPVCIKTNNCSFKKRNSSEFEIRKHKSSLVVKVNKEKNS